MMRLTRNLFLTPQSFLQGFTFSPFSSSRKSGNPFLPLPPARHPDAASNILIAFTQTQKHNVKRFFLVVYVVAGIIIIFDGKIMLIRPKRVKRICDKRNEFASQTGQGNAAGRQWCQGARKGNAALHCGCSEIGGGRKTLVVARMLLGSRPAGGD
ncbi:MAG: hypothetical protein LBS42_06460 [Tannerella sp.]|jgi:hypothetical protein|nr:hypothetical protein [Tannerella sp.]